MSDQPGGPNVRKRTSPEALVICIVAAVMMSLVWLLNATTSPAQDQCDINKPHYTSGVASQWSAQGWSQPMYSPNGEYILKTRITHDGQHSFVVLTADCTREIYYGDSPKPYTMSEGGCYTDGWKPDGTVRFWCVYPEPDTTWLLHPDTRTFSTACTGKEPESEIWSKSIQWSPDGHRIAMVVRSSFTPYTLYVVDRDGSHLTRLAVVPFDSSADWSPDGKSIAYTQDGETIEVIGTHGTHQRELTAGYDPHWLSDGKTIAFLREDGLYSINPDGSNLNWLVQADLRSFAWSPDGSHIAIVQATKNRLYPDKIIIIPAQPFDDQHITISDQLYVDNLAWSPDGKKIAFTGRDDLYGDKAAYLIDSDGTGLKKLADETIDYPPSWGPDGKTLIFGRRRPDGEMGVTILNLDDGTQTDLDYGALQELELSSDGVTLAMTRHNNVVYVGNIDGRPLVNLTEMLDSQFEHPCR